MPEVSTMETELLELQQRVAENDKVSAAYIDAQQRLKATNTMMTEKNEEAKHLTQQLNELAGEDLPPMESLDQESQKLRELQDKIRNMAPRLAQLKTEMTAQRQMQQDLEVQQAMVAGYEREREELLKILAGVDVTDEEMAKLRQTISEMDDYRAKVAEIKSRLSERSQTWERARTNVLDIEKRMEKDQKLRQTSDHLETARDLLSRSGIPGTFMRERFAQIGDLAQMYLQQLGTDFTIHPSKDELTFEVQRLQDGDQLQGMHKLSGGQRVRLSVAFLLAAQQIMIPRFRFLTLDEPSTHLDEEGADSMINLFTELSQTTLGEDTQVWVVDHSPEFSRAFTDLIQL
jgi:DNA repair exonuclease SbcCD ATPase subunit